MAKSKSTSTVEQTAENLTHQPALPTLELPEYHGRKPVGMRTGVNGAGNRITKAHSIDDRVIILIEARVKKAGHEQTDDGLIYTETLKVLDLFEIAGDQGARLLSTVRSAYRTADDATAGRAPVPGLGDVGYTDASGVVLTSKEVAALRGDPVRALITEGLTPVVVIYSDGKRESWPDDFAKDFPRPYLGQEFEADDGGSVVTVAELLHHETGEPLDGAPIERSTVTIDITDGEPAEADADGVEPFDAGGFDDGVPAFDAAEQWENPTPPRPLTADEAAAEAKLPRPADFLIVDCGVDILKGKLEEITDLQQLDRLLMAERQGRGRALKPRQSALDAITKRLATLGVQ